MKLKSLVSAAMLATACFAANAVSAQEPTGTLKKIKETGSITLGHRESSIPFSYYDDRQQVVGYSQELMLKVVDAVKQELKVPTLLVKMLPVTSQNRITLVQNGTVDLECGSTTNNTERQKQVAFSNSIFVVSLRFMTKKDSGVKEISDFAGKTVATTAGTSNERLLRELNEQNKMNMNIISAKDHGEAFLTLETGRAVAFFMDDALLYGERAKAKKPDDWIVAGKPARQEVYGCMLRKEDPQFKKVVDTALAKAMTSGEAEKIYNKWFMSPIPPKGLNLNFPISADLAALYKNPNDTALQ